MFTTILIGVAITLGAGLIAKVFGHVLYTGDGEFHVSWAEFTIGALALSFIIVPATTAIGYNVARGHAMERNEWWGGLEKTADVETVTCKRDGWGCKTYECDPYQVPVTRTRTVSDGKGGTRTETYIEMETRWHSCPYAKREYHYTISDTLGDRHEIGGRRVDTDRKAARFRSGKAIPDSMKSGIPKFWSEAKARIDAQNPGGVTKRVSYPNYIQAAQDDIYVKFSDRIKDFKKFMPVPAKDTIDPYLAEKFYALSIPGVDRSFGEGSFNSELMRFNGKLGSTKQGDLHVVAVPTTKVTEPDEYTQALEAYFQSPELGKDTLSKNGIVAVLGVNPTTSKIEWARGFTGMPMGNEDVVQAISSQIRDVDFTPTALFGTAAAGAVPTLADIIGSKYDRVEMKKYAYLKDEIQPGTGAKVIILVVGLILSLGLWAIFLAVDLRILPNRVAHKVNDRAYHSGRDVDWRPDRAARRTYHYFDDRY